MLNRLPHVRSFGIVISTGVFAFFSGCQTWTASDLPEPELAPAVNFAAPGEFNELEVADGWLVSLGAEGLDALVTEALENSPSLGATAASLDAALASAKIAGARLFPAISADFNGRRSLNNTSAGSNIYSTNTGLSAGVSWEIDLWGRVKNNRDASTYDYQASEADFIGARLSLVATVARLWVENVAAREQLALAERTLEAFEENEAVIEGRFERGLSNALDLQLIRTTTEGARGTVSVRKEQFASARRSLELSLGRYPSGELAIDAMFPDVVEQIPVGLPAALLERRPDLLAAEARMDAQGQRALAANKNRLPTLSLSGSIGRSGSDIDNLGDPDFGVWSIFGGLAAPIFNFGRLEAEQIRGQAQYRQAALGYVSTALRAFNEVEGFLAGEVYLDERLTAAIAAEQAAVEAERISWERYRSGLVDIVTVLDSQRRADNARRDVISLRAQKLQNRIDLHTALGGDFE